METLHFSQGNSQHFCNIQELGGRLKQGEAAQEKLRSEKESLEVPRDARPFPLEMPLEKLGDFPAFFRRFRLGLGILDGFSSQFQIGIPLVDGFRDRFFLDMGGK